MGILASAGQRYGKESAGYVNCFKCSSVAVTFCGSMFAVSSPAAVDLVARRRGSLWAIKMLQDCRDVRITLPCSLSLCYSVSLPVFSVCLPVSPTSLLRRSALRRPQLDAMAIRGGNQSSYSLNLELSLCRGKIIIIFQIQLSSSRTPFCGTQLTYSRYRRLN